MPSYATGDGQGLGVALRMRTPAKAGVTLSAANLTTRVRRGQVVTIYLRGIHRDPTSWDNTLQFNPSRHDPALITDQHRQLLAFGLGPRGCIGQHLAMAELMAVLPALACHGRITIDEPVTEDASFALRVRESLTGEFVRSAQT